MAQAIKAESEDEMTVRVPEITKTQLFQVLDDAFEQRDFQRFISVIVHAQTCKECRIFFFEAMKRSEFHLNSELR